MLKKQILTLMVMIAAVSAQADNYDYPYLTFETADGTKTSISTASLTIHIQDGKLMAGSTELTLADLSKMYFSTSDETTGIEEVNMCTNIHIDMCYPLSWRNYQTSHSGSTIFHFHR